MSHSDAHAGDGGLPSPLDEMLPDLDRCGLCLESVELLRSHLIPRFVIRWIQDTSATGLMLSPISGGRPLQDAPTRRLFCSNCEEILSADEKLLAERAFRPRHLTGFQWTGFAYSEWLSRFSAGLMLKAALSRAPAWTAVRFEKSVLPALRAFLLRRAVWPKPYEMHLVFTDYFPADGTTERLASNIQWYVMRGVDMTVVTNAQRQCYLYASMPGFQFWMPVAPVHDPYWDGTRIGLRGSFQSPSKQHVGVPGWLDFLNSRATATKERIASTPGQLAARARRIERNTERATDSESLRAWLVRPR